MLIRGLILAAAVGVCALSACGGDPSASEGGSGGDAGLEVDSAGGGSSRGASGGSGTGGGIGTGSGTGASPADGGGACIGSSLLAALGKPHLLVGGSMQAATASLAPFDVQYIYISGGFDDGTGPCASCASGCSAAGKTCANSGGGCAWWGCYQDDQVPPGAFVRGFDAAQAALQPPAIPMYTYYQILQASGVAEGAPEVTLAATRPALMARYFADWRFLLQQIGAAQALLHIEPDFWGYAQQQAADPTTAMASVASANPTDCASQPDTIAGLGKCMIAMARKYAPRALVALHASAWSTGMDVSVNTSPTFDVAAEARKTAAFLAACGEGDADFVVVETSDRDAGYDQIVEKRMVWWDPANAALPDFHQDLAWVKALTEALSKPALYWQTPLGNMSLNNTANHYTDNRVDYFLAHMSELADAHAIGAVFGAGAGDQTAPESDGNNFVSKARAYAKAGGQGLCP